MKDIEVLVHSAIRIAKGGYVIYIDPFNIDENYNDADFVFITHSHYDHYSKEDLSKVINSKTIIIASEDIKEEGFFNVIPNKEYEIAGLKFFTVRAYNKEKEFHPKENNWVGYVINIENILYYIAGDTDGLEENENLKVDIAFVPVGGKYTMDYLEAADFINKLKPKIVIPTHYGSIVGSKEEGLKFKEKLESLNKDTKVKIML